MSGTLYNLPSDRYRELTLLAQFAHEQAHEIADLEYFEDLVRGVVKNHAVLDEALKPYLDRPFDEIDFVEKAILRVSAYELKYRLDVPYKVIINEAIELAKAFAADDSHKFVNGILDKAVRVLRPS